MVRETELLPLKNKRFILPIVVYGEARIGKCLKVPLTHTFAAIGKEVIIYCFEVGEVRENGQIGDILNREFFRFFNGFWTEEDSYNFVMIAVSREQRFTINFSSFYSEWGPTADIISLVKGCLGEGLFAQIEYDLTETTKGRKWMYITIDGKGCLEILDFNTMERRIYEKGIPYPDLASLAVPDIIYAAALCEEDAMVYLEAYNLPYLLNLWHPYVIEEVPNEKATFHEDYYGGTITIYSDASGKITKVETGK